MSCNHNGVTLDHGINDNDSENDVALWLRNEVQLCQYINAFIENGYDSMVIVLDLTNKDLIDIGITKIGHRNHILKCVRQYNGCSLRGSHSKHSIDDLYNVMIQWRREMDHRLGALVHCQRDSQSTNRTAAAPNQRILSQQQFDGLMSIFEEAINPKSSALREYQSKSEKLKSLINLQFPKMVEVDPVDARYLDISTKYLKLNPSPRKDPDITMKVVVPLNSPKRSRTRSRSKRTRSRNCRKSRFETMKQSEIIEVETIRQCQRWPSLIGQQGLRTKRHIAKDTVIGEYYGREYLQNEVDLLSPKSGWDHITTNEHAFYEVVTGQFTKQQIEEMERVEIDEFPPSKRRRVEVDELNNDNQSTELLQRAQFQVFIDGLHHPTPSMMIKINDCKLNLSQRFASEEDLEFMNVVLKTVRHEGWPKILAITTKDVAAGERLWTDYGEQFCIVEPEKALYRKRKNRLEQQMRSIMDRNDQ